MAPFITTRKVRFADCDPAGIVFYPRHFEMINGVVEDWFRDGLHYGFAKLHLDDGMTVPTAHIEADFIAPSRLDDELSFRLQVQKIGRTSATLSITVKSGDDDRLKVMVVIVFVDLNKGQTQPWPDDIRTKMTHFQETEK